MSLKLCRYAVKIILDNNYLKFKPIIGLRNSTQKCGFLLIHNYLQMMNSFLSRMWKYAYNSSVIIQLYCKISLKNVFICYNLSFIVWLSTVYTSIYTYNIGNSSNKFHELDQILLII